MTAKQEQEQPQAQGSPASSANQAPRLPQAVVHQGASAEQAPQATAQASSSTSAMAGPSASGPGPRSAAGMISGLLAKLTPPRIMRDAAFIPRFRETCWEGGAGNEEGIRASDNTDSTGDNSSVAAGDPPRPRQPRALPTTWEEHTRGADFTNSFATLLGGYPLSSRSLVFFGEQHHQPPVIRAQVQLLAAMARVAKEDGGGGGGGGGEGISKNGGAAESPAATASSHAASSRRRTQYHLHLLMEHFSILDQPLLDSFHSGQTSIAELCSAYRASSREGFKIEMYAPLLLLARESGARIWGGFPPRDWARVAFREGIKEVQALERKRHAGNGGGGDSSSPSSPPPPSSSISPFRAWSNVAMISRSHRAFLSALMRPEEPPTTTAAMRGQEGRDGGDPLSPSSAAAAAAAASSSPIVAQKGFGPAQALKDSYLAHVAGELLSRGHAMRSGSGEGGGGSNTDVDVEHRNVVMVVAGLGHVEGGFGAPERVGRGTADIVDVNDDGGDGRGPGESTACLSPPPLIILSKPNDSGLWLGPEWEQRDRGRERVTEDRGEQSQAAKTASPQRDVGWDRKLADAIVLYDWVDFDAEAAGGGGNGNSGGGGSGGGENRAAAEGAAGV